MEKRLIVALALSMLIIVAFQHFFVKPPPKLAPAVVEKNSPQPTAHSPQLQPARLQENSSAAGGAPSSQPQANEKELIAETDKYIITFSNIGGAIKKIQLKDYKTLNSDKPLDLAEINNPREYIFSIHDPLNTMPLDISTYDVTRKGNDVTYSLRLKNLEIIKRYILRNSKNIIELQLIINNTSPNAQEFNYRIIGGAGIIEPQIQDKRLIEVVSDIDGKIFNYKRPKNNRIINPGVVNWTALKNKYFSILLKPLVQTKNQFYSENINETLVSGVEPASVTIPPGSSTQQNSLLYVGPSSIPALKRFGFGAEASVNYGIFGWISKALLSLLGLCHMLVRNWGISVIILSVFLNVILFPLSSKSFKSMQKMQALHPQMEKLKAQFKDNPQKLNKEIMGLYKKYKINPLSGCLPMLLQMPIFIALYQALMKSVDLRGASFLWIKDLSSPDAVSIPFSLPLLGNSINILPILMLITMVIQQKLSTKTMGGAVTAEQKQQQQLMLIVMPIMFGFIFYNMPSGLVLYWVINTALTIVEQAIIFKKA